jgi:hypothetical protein
MLILSSFPTLPLSGKRLTGFGTLTTPSEDGIRLPQFHRASPSTALDKKRTVIISYIPLEVKAVPPPLTFQTKRIENSNFLTDRYDRNT